MSKPENRPDWTVLRPSVVSIYGRFVREEYWLLAGVMLVVLASAGLAVITPYFFSRLVDDLVGTNLPAAIAWGFVFYAVMRGLLTATAYSVNYLSIIAAENLNFITATSFFERLLGKPGSFFIDNNPVQIQTARQEGQNALYGLVQMAIHTFLPGGLQIGLAMALMGAVINIEIALIVLVYGSFFISLTYLANRWTRPLLDRAIEAYQDNARFVGNAVNAMETLRYFNGDRWISEKFSEKAGLARKSWVGWSRRRLLLTAIFGTALGLQLALTFLILLPRFEAGEVTVGDIVLINLLLVQLNQPFEMIGMAIDEVMRAMARLMPFARIWQAPEDRGQHGDRPVRIERARIAFENVGFRYGDRETVRDVSFVAEPGRLTFLVGPTGSGKTTLFKLALKSLEPSSGRILINDMDLRDLKRSGWYDAVGVVPQDVMLLNDSLATNIVLGRPYDAERMRRAAERASILAFVDGLPDGFETTVGERGLKLSGGERQRISIARALYADPKVLFLDEASSALDETTEGQIMAELRRIAGEVTVIAITHRRGVIAAEDQVVILKGSGDDQELEERA
ncbi:MAG: ABC transporter ATP-binding protein [Devosia sp.]|uniref:ABC transporter ATP-binding protein n=1 Tax=Devosia sp. TaxID=1871048 RepID=UPI0024CB7158|nr:ABC transporter ATP-binding protein [Devosia sp.]UYN98282.1 MAG: ABC transporter ATP-binding protein [Devosia sp.]